MPAMREVERNIKEYAQTDTGTFTNYDQIRERKEANGLLHNSGIMHNSEQLARMERELEQTGILPKIAFRESENLDANKDQHITREELTQITENPDNYAPTVVLAAREAEKHWDELDKSGKGYITRHDLGDFSRQATRGRKADPDQMFGEYGDPNNAGQDNEAEKQRSTGNPSESSPEAVANGPTERSPEERDQNAPPAEDPTVKTAKPGQGIWDIAKEACPEGASNAEIARMWKAIMEENHMNRKSRLAVGQQIKLPGTYPAAPSSEDPNID